MSAASSTCSYPVSPRHRGSRYEFPALLQIHAPGPNAIPPSLAHGAPFSPTGWTPTRDADGNLITLADRSARVDRAAPPHMKMFNCAFASEVAALMRSARSFRRGRRPAAATRLFSSCPSAARKRAQTRGMVAGCGLALFCRRAMASFVRRRPRVKHSGGGAPQVRRALVLPGSPPNCSRNAGTRLWKPASFSAARDHWRERRATAAFAEGRTANPGESRPKPALNSATSRIATPRPR
jgi:hypothetical protein